MPTVFTRKTNGFSCLYDRKLTQSYTTSQDGFTCPDKYRSLPKQSGKIIFQTLALWPFRDKSLYACKHGWRIAKHFPILSPFYNSSGPVGYSESRPGPYLFHSIGMQNQFPHYGQAVVLPYQVPMPHASPSTSSVASSESKTQRTKKIHSQELRTGTVALTGQTRRQAIYLNCGGTISQSARKETALCGTPS